MVGIPVGGGFYQSPSLPVSAQECTNWYPNWPQADALSPQTLFPTPGITSLTTTSAAHTNRGGIEFGGNVYIVNSNSLYRVDETIDGAGVKTYSTTSLGTIEGTGRVSISKSYAEIAITVPGGKSYIYSVSGGSPR